MIGRSHAKFRRQPRAARGAKLVRMQLEQIAQIARALQDAPRLLDGEGCRLAEDVAEARLAREGG